MLGLDNSRCWVIVSEHNVDEWPNAGLAAIPGKSHDFVYGFIPPRLFQHIKDKFLELSESGRKKGVRR